MTFNSCFYSTLPKQGSKESSLSLSVQTFISISTWIDMLILKFRGTIFKFYAREQYPDMLNATCLPTDKEGNHRTT